MAKYKVGDYVDVLVSDWDEPDLIERVQIRKEMKGGWHQGLCAKHYDIYFRDCHIQEKEENNNNNE